MAKADKAHPRMAMEALHRANGDRQKAWSEYIRLHYQSTGSLSPGCDARDFYACLDVQTLKLWQAAKNVVEASKGADVMDANNRIHKAVPMDVWAALEALV